MLRIVLGGAGLAALLLGVAVAVATAVRRPLDCIMFFTCSAASSLAAIASPSKEEK